MDEARPRGQQGWLLPRPSLQAALHAGFGQRAELRAHVTHLVARRVVRRPPSRLRLATGNFAHLTADDPAFARAPFDASESRAPLEQDDVRAFRDDVAFGDAALERPARFVEQSRLVHDDDGGGRGTAEMTGREAESATE